VSTLFRLEALEGRHDRSTFVSGEESLDRYFQTQVTQDIRRRITNCFVAVEVATGQVVAYYTIASASVSTPDLPPDEAKRLPRYPTMPAVRIGRLAVDQRFQGRGLGKALLADAAVKAMTAAPASFALLVDAKDDQAANFYKCHGFRSLGGLPRVLFLPLSTAEKVLLGK
jgi:ribosomal protein S18 acetylase RimI-like enzyme